MAFPNIDPIYSKQGDATSDGARNMATELKTAANDYSGTAVGTNLIATADPNNGGYIQRIRCKALGSNVASVLRLFLNNGLPNGLNILAPSQPTGSASASGGFLPTNANYTMALAARDAYGGWGATISTASASQNVTGPTGSITWSTTAVTNAAEYRFYLGISSVFTHYYTLSNAPNIWGYVTGTASTTGGTVAAGTNFCMVDIQTTTGRFLLPCSTSGVVTTGTTSSIVWVAPTIVGQGAVISYDYWFGTAAITPAQASQYHTGTLSPQANTYTQTLPASSYTGTATTPAISGSSVWIQTQPQQFYQAGVIAAGGVETNNTLIGEIALPATTAIATTTTVDIDYPLNLPLPPGFRLFAALGTSVSAGWAITPIMGKY